jgi:L-asparaginase/Glu-tRNA(Gln) amidotransferase subunit D
VAICIACRARITRQIAKIGVIQTGGTIGGRTQPDKGLFVPGALRMRLLAAGNGVDLQVLHAAYASARQPVGSPRIERPYRVRR